MPSNTNNPQQNNENVNSAQYTETEPTPSRPGKAACDTTEASLGSVLLTPEKRQIAAMLAEAQSEQPSPEDLQRYILHQQQQAVQNQARASSSQHPGPQMVQQQPPLMMEMEDPEDSDDDGNGRSEKRAGRRKIRIEYIEDKSRRHITFSKRKAGIMKKAYELSTLTGTQVLLLVASETGHVYTFATPKLQPLITKPEGKNLIQACLNAPDGSDYAHQHGPYDDDSIDDRPQMPASTSAGIASLSQNYAAAMAGLAGYPYSAQTGSNPAAVAQAYMTPAHYPAYAAAAQYNAAMASGYWPQGTSPQGHDRAPAAGTGTTESGVDN